MLISDETRSAKCFRFGIRKASMTGSQHHNPCLRAYVEVALGLKSWSYESAEGHKRVLVTRHSLSRMVSNL